MQPKDLAKELGYSAKTIREWLRGKHMGKEHTRYERWDLTEAQVKAVRQRFATRRQRAESRENMVVTTVALPERLHAQLVRAAREEHTVMTEIVRRAAIDWLKQRR